MPFDVTQRIRRMRGIRWAGVAALAGSTGLHNLTRLYLHGNNFGDAGALALAKSTVLDHLEDLTLDGGPLSTATARALRKRFGERARF